MKRISQFFRSKTSFPKIEVLDKLPPDLDECSSCSSDDESILREKNSGKIDEDVRVFMDIASRLSPDSLVFLLQNHLSTQLGVVPSRYTPPIKKKRAERDENGVVVLPKKKHFRFAEVLGGTKVREVVYEVSKHEDPSLWWDRGEMAEIRSRAIRTVKSFKKNRYDLSMSVAVLCEAHQPETPKQLVDEHMKKMTNDSFARGLESHIVEGIRELRSVAMKLTLKEQNRCRGLPYAESCERIRKTSIMCTNRTATLAIKLAECDHLVALTASLSRWRAEPMQATTVFFD